MILICGPCVIENFATLDADASGIKKIVDKHPIVDFYFKASCIKDNRSDLKNYYGPGFDVGIDYLLKIKSDYGIN